MLGPSWCAQHVGVLVLIMRLFRRSFASIGDFERRAATYWTSDRVQWLTNGKDVALAPDKPGVAPLLRVLGLLSPDGTMSDASMRKHAQLNAMHDAMERALAVPLQQGGSEPLRVVDMCTGSASHLALLLALASRWRWERAVHVLAVDGSASRLKAAQHRAALLGIGPDVLQFKASTIRELPSWIELYSDAFPRLLRRCDPAAPSRVRRTACLLCTRAIPRRTRPQRTPFTRAHTPSSSPPAVRPSSPAHGER